MLFIMYVVLLLYTLISTFFISGYMRCLALPARALIPLQAIRPCVSVRVCGSHETTLGSDYAPLGSVRIYGTYGISILEAHAN